MLFIVVPTKGTICTQLPTLHWDSDKGILLCPLSVGCSETLARGTAVATARAPELLCGQVRAFFLILSGSGFLVGLCVGGKADTVCQGQALCLLCREITTT